MVASNLPLFYSYIHSLFIHWLLNEQQDESAVTYRSFVLSENSQWNQSVLHITHKTAKFMSNFISQSCGDLQPASYLSREDGAIQRSPEHSWMSGKVQKQATLKAASALIASYMPEMLADAYSHCVMVDSVPCCCGHGSQVISNPVTNSNSQNLTQKFYCIKSLGTWIKELREHMLTLLNTVINTIFLTPFPLVQLSFDILYLNPL